MLTSKKLKKKIKNCNSFIIKHLYWLLSCQIISNIGYVIFKYLSKVLNIIGNINKYQINSNLFKFVRFHKGHDLPERDFFSRLCLQQARETSFCGNSAERRFLN